MKNNDERKQWLRNYRDWGLWYEDDHIGVKYYRYIFNNGAELIVDEYLTPKQGPVPERTSAYFHLIGGPNPPGRKWNYHPVYYCFPDSETYLIEFLKYIEREEEL